MRKLQALLILSGLSIHFASAIDIVVDYRYDSNNFFNTQAKRDAMQAAADRFSRVITSSLAAVPDTGTATGTAAGWRIGFTHPGTGDPFEVSTAANFATDPLQASGAADVYGFPGLNANEWILYAGGRPLASSGFGGTATGTNFEPTFDDINGPMHRGFNDNTPSTGENDESVNDLPRWGGSISFNSNNTWHFDLNTVPPGSVSDFYTIALHEIGHALGLSTSWNQWPDNGADTYTGAEAIAAHNDDNGTSNPSLSLEDSANDHFADNIHASLIFPNGEPVTIGVVPNGILQDLLMDPIANFGGQQDRFELTNVDVGALRDLGWTTTLVPPAGFRPDNTVGISLSSAIGNNLYNTASGQTLSLISRKARPVSAVVGVANDGITPDAMDVSGSAGNSLFAVTYTSGGSNVTAAIVSGTFSTAALSVGNPPEQINVAIRPNKRKIKKVIRRNGRRKVRYKKRSIALVVRSTSTGEPSAKDLSVISVRTR